MTIEALARPDTLPTETVPGPKGYPLVGSLTKAWKDPLAFTLKTAQEYGDIAHFSLGSRPVFLLNNPGFVQHVLQDNYRNYRKSDFYDAVRPFFGNGLGLSEGDFWRRQRQMAQPGFGREKLAAMATGMSECASDMVDSWRMAASQGTSFDVVSETMRLALSIAVRTLFSRQIDGEFRTIYDALTVALRHAEHRVWAPVSFPERVPTSRNREFLKAIRTLDRIVYGVIEQRRQSNEETNDLLSLFLAARDEETGEEMTDQQLRDEVLTIFIAGHETVASAMAFTFYLLSRHPDIERRVVQELENTLGGRAPAFEDLPKLEYTSRVVSEAMRLYPPVWTVSRAPIEDDEIGGHRVPAGATVMISPYVMHRNAKYWENPEGFDPERFTEENSRGRPRYAYFPFGGGPRICLGRHFAMMEAQIVLATVLQKYRVDVVPGQTVVPEPMISLRPRGGLNVTLRHR